MPMTPRLLADLLGDRVVQASIPEAIPSFSMIEYAFTAQAMRPGRAYALAAGQAAPPGCVVVTTADAGDLSGCAVIRCDGSLEAAYAAAVEAIDLHVRFERDLVACIERWQNLQALVDLAAAHLDNQLLVIDRTMKIVAMSCLPVTRSDDNWQYMTSCRRLPDQVVETMAPLYSRTKKSSARYAERLDAGTRLFGVPNVHADLTDGENFLGWLVLVANRSDLKSGHLDVLDGLAAPFSHVLKIRRMDRRPDVPFPEYYWMELLCGRLESAEIRNSLLAEHRWKAEDFFRVGVVRMGSATGDGGDARDRRNGRDGRETADFRNALNLREAGGGNALLLTAEDRIILVERCAAVGDPAVQTDAMLRLSAFTQAVQPSEAGEGRHAGISDWCAGISRIPLLFRQCELVSDHAATRNLQEPAFFPKIATELLLSGAIGAEDWRMYLHPALWRLSAHHAEAFGKWTRTLRVYLENERQLGAAARLLFVHKNTLLYRIRQIERALGIDLDDATERLRMLQSLMILGARGIESL